MLGLKIFVWLQTFCRGPFMPSHNFCHPVQSPKVQNGCLTKRHKSRSLFFSHLIWMIYLNVIVKPSLFWGFFTVRTLDVFFLPCEDFSLQAAHIIKVPFTVFTSCYRILLWFSIKGFSRYSISFFSRYFLKISLNVFFLRIFCLYLKWLYLDLAWGSRFLIFFFYFSFSFSKLLTQRVNNIINIFKIELGKLCTVITVA